MIVCVGEALVDLYAEPVGAGIDTATHFVPRFGGAPANVALTLGRLGLPSRFVGAVGRDAFGARLANALSEARVDTRCLLRVPERTGITFVRRSLDGERAFLFYRSLGADAALSVASVAAMSPPPYQGARWVVLGSSALLVPPMGEAVRGLLRDATAQGARVFVDLNARAHLWGDPADMRAAALELCSLASVVKGSEEDCAAMGVPATLDGLRSLAPRASVVLTLAERGAVARIGGDELRCDATPVATVVDATGAGDAFVAGLLAGLAGDGGDEWERGLAAGCALGAMACTGCGATDAVVPPWPAAVQRALAGRARSA